jgi:hypothetical protein
VHPALLGLIGAEFVAGIATVLTYRRRLRAGDFTAAMRRIDELVLRALDAGKRAQDPRLSLAQRAALLEETRSALQQAQLVLRGTPVPLDLALSHGLIGLPASGQEH